MAKLKSIIGCEITTNEIRAVELTKENGFYNILAMGYMPLEEGIVEEGFIRDADRFNSAITQLLASGNFQTTDVAVAVNNENVLMRYASFPKVDSDKLRNMVLLQAQEFIPIPIQEMEVDYVVAGETKDDDDVAQTNVMLIAARRQMLEGYINIFTASKLQIQDIDSSLLAYCRGINEICNGAKYGIVNLTDDILSYIVVHGNEISMVRSITIPEKMQGSVAAIFKNSRDESYSEEDLTSVISFLMQETSSTISYYAMQNNIPMEKIYLIVNSTANQKILENLQENIYIPMEIPQFYPSLQSTSATPLGEYASCIGVAISGLEG